RHLAAVAAVRQPADLQLLRDRDRAVPGDRTDPGAGTDPRACQGVVPEEAGGCDRGRSLPGRGGRAVRLVLADLDRPADHDAALAAADLVPPLDLIWSHLLSRGRARRPSRW